MFGDRSRFGLPQQRTSAAEIALRDPTLTEEERSNLELVMLFRQLPVRDRAQYTTTGFTPKRIGTADVAGLSEPDSVGYKANSIPDRVDLIHGIIARGDRVWTVWTIHGTHLGELYGIAPTGRKIVVTEVGQWRIERGLIVEAWFMVDELSLLRQLGHWPIGS